MTPLSQNMMPYLPCVGWLSFLSSPSSGCSLVSPLFFGSVFACARCRSRFWVFFTPHTPSLVMAVCRAPFSLSLWSLSVFFFLLPSFCATLAFASLLTFHRACIVRPFGLCLGLLATPSRHGSVLLPLCFGRFIRVPLLHARQIGTTVEMCEGKGGAERGHSEEERVVCVSQCEIMDAGRSEKWGWTGYFPFASTRDFPAVVVLGSF